MKILVTGGAGFIGSAVVRLAISQGHTVVNFDALRYSACLDNLASVASHPNYHFVRGDICSRFDIKDVFSKYAPDKVIHLAAESHVDRSIDGPEVFMQSNIIGTFNLLEVFRSYWIELGCPGDFRFHHVSTDEVFGSLSFDSAVKFTETSPYMPSSPYSASKAASDHLVRAWHDTYQLPVLLSNCSNNYGPYQFPEKLIPVIIINAILGEDLPVYGDGRNVRDWLHVDDHASALLLLLENGNVGESYNVGGDNECSNISLVKKICSILDSKLPKSQGKYSEQITFVTDRPGHDKRYSIDASKIERELGWKREKSFDDGLESTVDWYLANEAWWKAILEKNSMAPTE